MSTSAIPSSRGSDRLPSFAHAAVADVMHPGIVTCPPETDLVTVARMMATHHIHCVLVSGVERAAGGERPAWGLLSDLDLVAAAMPDAAGADADAIASTEVVTVPAAEPLETAAQLMVEHQLAHLLVLGPRGAPVGVVSTLDVAGAIAWGEA